VAEKEESADDEILDYDDSSVKRLVAMRVLKPLIPLIVLPPF
jgi:hypothetical protein